MGEISIVKEWIWHATEKILFSLSVVIWGGACVPSPSDILPSTEAVSCAISSSKQVYQWDGAGLHGVFAIEDRLHFTSVQPAGRGRVYFYGGHSATVDWNRTDCFVRDERMGQLLSISLSGPGADAAGQYRIASNGAPIFRRFQGLNFSEVVWDQPGQLVVVGVDSLGRNVRSAPFGLNANSVVVEVR